MNLSDAQMVPGMAHCLITAVAHRVGRPVSEGSPMQDIANVLLDFGIDKTSDRWLSLRVSETTTELEGEHLVTSVIVTIGDNNITISYS